ncbi:MAG: RNA 2',3'-cyclic phosphodiesterase [Elusimicrobia bacterium]|nr:RNA 2',3'-cyclic phosphodiesterase [Elusimicrobiota bacterium]
MRLFVAIPIPETIQKTISGYLRSLKGSALLPAQVKWVASKNLHLTLKFLGEVPDDRLKSLQASLRQSVLGKNIFSLQMKGLGCFPDSKRARVLWVGVNDPAGRLSGLAERVESHAVDSGFERADKPFSAHLTLARFPFPCACDSAIVNEKETLFGEFVVSNLSLIQSSLHPSGPIYTTVSEFNLES